MKREIAKILVRGTNWIGDSVITLPALRELRRALPGAHLALLVKPWVADLFAGADFLDEVIPYDRGPGIAEFLRFARTLRARDFDAAILLQNAFEAAALAVAARIPVRIGFPTDGRRLLLTHPLRAGRPVRHTNQMYGYLNIAAQAEELLTGGSRVDFLRPQYRLEADPGQKERMRRRLREARWRPGQKIVAVNPGATNNPLKRWPAERFALLADRLSGEAGCTVVLIGGASEEAIADDVLGRMRKSAVKLTGRTSLRESVALLELSDLVVSNDTGPAYVAAALDRPTLTIFGPTDCWAICPTSPTVVIVCEPVPCAPCRVRRCPENHACMRRITVDRVYETALGMLEAGRPPAR